jgi:ElaB/YqjD/DUF883 family membrane-anchored ribosome-binding protein
MSQPEQTISRAKEGFGNLVEHTRSAVNHGLDTAESTFDRSADQVLHRTEQLRQGAVRLTDEARARVDRAQRGLSGIAQESGAYVAANPGKVMLGALAAGFVLGFALRGRRTSNN